MVALSECSIDFVWMVHRHGSALAEERRRLGEAAALAWLVFTQHGHDRSRNLAACWALSSFAPSGGQPAFLKQ